MKFVPGLAPFDDSAYVPQSQTAQTVILVGPIYTMN